MPKNPSVRIYIRRGGTRRYERLKTRNPQSCGEGDVYCLHLWHNGKRQWITVGTDINEVFRQQMVKQNELMRGARTASDPIEKPRTLKEWQKDFLEFKRTTTKKDGTPLDEETIEAYQQQTDEFLSVCQGGKVTGMDLRRYMATLRKRGLSHRSVCNHYTSIATFLKFAGIDHKELLPYGERPTPDDPVVEAYEEAVDLGKVISPSWIR
jgi:hypothetical protein